jgi:hypothetical protein
VDRYLSLIVPVGSSFDREIFSEIEYPIIMRDSDVRSAVRNWLHGQYAHNSRIVEEMGIWSGTVRIDIAVINGELHGFELKSERDTLARLGDQAGLYNQVFDRMTLVTARRHLDKATSKIPLWWGIIAAQLEGGVVTLKPIKKARPESEHRSASISAPSMATRGISNS